MRRVVDVHWNVATHGSRQWFDTNAPRRVGVKFVTEGSWDIARKHQKQLRKQADDSAVYAEAAAAHRPALHPAAGKEHKLDDWNAQAAAAAARGAQAICEDS